MTESISTWVARLANEPLPVMRRTLTRTRDLLNKTSASHNSLKEVIECDPGFSLHVFRLINNLPKRPKEPVSKLGNAISLLGMDKIEQALQESTGTGEPTARTTQASLLDCYSRAAHASIYASELALRLKFREAEVLASAALLHDIGEMALWNAAPDLMQQIQQLMKQGESRENAALQVLGFTLEDMNQELGSRWQLPKLVQDSQGLFNSFQAQPLTVMLACAVARDSAQSWTSQECLDHLELLAEFLEISQEQAQAQLHQTAALAARKLHGLSLPLPAFRLAHAAGILTSQLTKPTEAKPEPTLKAKSEAKPKGKPEVKPAPARIQPSAKEKIEKTAPPIPEKKTQAESRPAPSRNPLHESLMRTIEEMKDTHGLDNVMFAMLSSNRQDLISRFVVANEENSPLKGFQVNLQQPSLFSALIKKPQALWLNPGNLEKYTPMIPQAFLQILCRKGFLIMSVFIKNKPVGLFYADNGCGNTVLTANQYNNFKVLCQRFMQELS